MVCAASGGTVAAVLPAGHALTTLLVSYMLWGMGMGLSFAIITLYIHRLAVHNLPKAEVQPAVGRAFTHPCHTGKCVVIILGARTEAGRI